MMLLRLISCITLCCILTWRLSAQPGIPEIVAPADSIGMYRITIDLDTLHFTGLLLLKKSSDSTFRVVMNADMGPKLLDMDIVPSGFKIRYAFPRLNHRRILKILREDFGALTGILNWKKSCVVENKPGSSVSTFDLGRNKKVLYFSNSDLKTFSSGKVEADSQVITEFQYFVVPDASWVSAIKLRHLNFRMNITLDRL